ncbi:hypothetical protein UFOVP140_50 [uncultured Caudovirales phage]|uniref:Uncharacterized protein n=1 Tax=uncultured Caudovirales phage TaxID=2100421 RepID=A0A6J5LF32_9CAUD|nr:hypothetical protein UFOVP140_50 [uncultured Caudovirales phage]
MIIDNFLTLSGSWASGVWTPQTVTGASAVLSTNTIDLSQNRDMGEGTELNLRVGVPTAFTGLTALTMEIIVADDAALTSNVTVIGSSGAIPVASLTAGSRFVVGANPRIGSKGQRYLGARYTPTGTGTAGALIAELGTDIADGQKFYPVGFAVL